MMRVFVASLLLFSQFINCFAQRVANNTLFFTPRETGRMWDTWMYYANKTFYLYYLITEKSPGEGIGLATSKDGVHWRERGKIFSKSDSAQWIGSGSVWRNEDRYLKDKYVMNFSEWYGPGVSEGQQYIYFAASNDLIHWTRTNVAFKPDTSFYRINEDGGSRWDCIYSIPKAGRGRYGYWTANPKSFNPGFGFGQTSDGMHWTALPPPVIKWGNQPKLPGIEAGAVQYFKGRYYMMAGSLERYEGHIGMFTLESEYPGGPFYPSKENFGLLTSPPHLSFTYFARFFPYKGEILVNHQTMDRKGRRYFGLLKLATVDKDSILRLKYWDGNEGYKSKMINLGQLQKAKNPYVRFFPHMADIDNGIVIEGDFPTSNGTPENALYIETGDGIGTAIFMADDGRVRFGGMNESTGHFIPDDIVYRAMEFPSKIHFKLFLKGPLLELYIDDIFIQCYSLPAQATGRIGVVSQGEVRHLKCWAVQ